MAADLSRVRFDPYRDVNGVELQQGRLVLDADWNEQVAVVDRRLRALVADLAPGVEAGTGPATRSRLTPDAFKVTLSGGKLSIAPGRMYVDGLLAENHGATGGDFNVTLAEPVGHDAVDYAAQPYWKTPTTLPTSGTHLAYLKVWHREVTALQAPDLVEPAVGVDTTTRGQTAWQVRLLTPEVAADDLRCDTPLSDWDHLIAPSGARLTTDTVEVDDDAEPCELPPAGGYRGPENHLYRIELHTGGDSPTFKWSRDNASVVLPVVEIVSGTTLRLATLGRDSALGLHDGDWVEIIDDHFELDGTPGDMRKIVVDADTNTISFTGTLSGGLTPSGTGDDTVDKRHLRVIRWDQRGKVMYADGSSYVDLDASATGTIPVPTNGKAVLLEHGVTVKFDVVPPGKPHPGDYWVFAARASDASLEKLVTAPPRGIHYHYARLAIVTFPGTVVEDCRALSEPPGGDGCGCEVCVAPGGDIQAAIDAVAKAGGGTVTLCSGTYPLTEPLRLDRVRSVRLRGEGAATALVAEGTAILVTGSLDVTVERLAVVAGGQTPVVLVGACWGVRLSELTVTATGESPSRTAIGLTSVLVLGSVERCFVAASVGIGVVAPPAPTGGTVGTHGTSALKTGLFTIGLRLEGNTLMASHHGIDLSGLCAHLGPVRIAGNTVFGPANAGIAATGLVLRGLFADGLLTIEGNDVTVGTGYGIVTGGCAAIRDNAVASTQPISDRHGIYVAAEPPGVEPGPVHVVGNRVTNVGGYGIAVEAPVRGLLVKLNIVAGAGGGVVVRGPGPKEQVSIDNNQILDVRPTAQVGAVPADLSPAAGDAPTAVLTGDAAAVTNETVLVGIGVTGAQRVGVLGNFVSGVGTEPALNAMRIGIAAVACDEVRIGANTVAGVGPDGEKATGLAFGIGVVGAANVISVEQNTIANGTALAASPRRDWCALFVAAATASAIAGAYTTPVDGGRFLTVDSRWAYLQADARTHVTVDGNCLFGGGSAAAAEVVVLGDAVFIGNQCAQAAGTQLPAVQLKAGSAIVQSNRAQGGHPSIQLRMGAEAAVVLGNITSGDIQVGGVMVSQTGKAWSQLNAVVP